MKFFGTIAAAAVGALMWSAAPSSAATVTLGSCVVSSTLDVTGYVSPTSSCFSLPGLSDGDTAKLTDLNDTLINGATGGWASLGKFPGSGGSNTNWALDDDTSPLKAGDWDIFAAASSVYGEFMMIFKSGQDRNTDPAAFVGYIMDGTSGTWTSPLLKDDGSGDQRDLSNVELFARGGSVPVVPLPASGLLLIAGLGGLAAMRRRKS